MPKVKESNVPHIFKTTDVDFGECQHLCMCREGAIQAHLLHHGLAEYNKEITVEDLGPIKSETDRGSICFVSLCVLYGLSFDE